MARLCIVLLGLSLLIASPASAGNLLNDNFESGVSSAVWTQVAVAGQSLLDGDTGGHHIGNQSAKQVNAFTNGITDVYYMRNKPGTVTAPTLTTPDREVATVLFWDENIRTDTSGDGPIAIGGAMMLANSGGSDFYQIGVNNAVSLNNYYVRTSLGGNVATGVARTQGWHQLGIEVLPYTGTNDVIFYIDNVNVGSGNRRPNTGSGFILDEVRLGLSVRTPDSPFWFDNVSLDVVPEPVSLLLLAPALALLRRRRAAC